MKKSIDLVCARIRRDANTTTPVTVLEHELPILYEIYGKESVTVDDADHDTYPVDVDGEYQRLANKYGLTIVEEVYGRESSGRLADAFKRAATTKSAEDVTVAKRHSRRPAQPEPTEEKAVAP